VIGEKFTSEEDVEGRRKMMLTKLNLQQYYCQHWRASAL
jgi:hypothetical protein